MIQFVNEFPVLMLILARVSSFFVTVPLFSYRNIPTTHKIGLSFFISYLIFFTIDRPNLEIDYLYIMLVMKEVIVGLLIGLAAYIVTTVIQIAGGFIDFQMGFAIANVIDPQTGVQSPIMGQYIYTFAILLMLVLNAHHLLLDGVFYSYQIVPLEQVWPHIGKGELAEFMTKTFNSVFIIAFQMAIPLVGCLFLMDVALGIVARTVPQLNVFVVGLPLKILVSFFVMTLMMPVFMMLVQDVFMLMFKTMRGLMEIIGGT
ncbi:flagellar biosynthetic protein FliR [Bacillus solimangrovi]|uniref:Flagellar biosynthetic protein FliR n=1 Tax=Bacillus solimangrovi TaxID=1305675 RepID=A0A1E5LB19_9BACI|nr:flagellar biosynthetic protein FliR [Bacillus solimangrovi]OEH91275.1 flagellar biosynthetic protein FliR [Bacillus solimangrovi]